jgi:hypothetical protein
VLAVSAAAAAAAPACSRLAWQAHTHECAPSGVCQLVLSFAQQQ